MRAEGSKGFMASGGDGLTGLTASQQAALGSDDDDAVDALSAEATPRDECPTCALCKVAMAIDEQICHRDAFFHGPCAQHIIWL